jgi:hypothetical protein
MAQIVAEFFSVVGVDGTPPANMQELIPYLLTVTVGMFLVSAVLKVIGGIVDELFGMRRM